MRLRFVTSVALTLLLSAGSGPSRAGIAEGDSAWADRAGALAGERAQPARIEEAIRQYRAAVAADPDSLEARWKLLRACHYAIDFTSLAEETKDALLEDAVALAETSIERLEQSDVEESVRARLLFWVAIAWGTRTQRVGLLTIVREGVAGRMRDYATQSLALDPGVDDGGALRLLARLHATLPRVPFISGWVDREKALPFAERAYALDPAHPGNRLVLALTLLEQAPERTDEARKLLESVAGAEPRAEFLVEDLSIREQARQRLEALDAIWQ